MKEQMPVLCFVSKSEEKFKEIQKILDVEVQWFPEEIRELQTNKVEKLVEQKALEAFKILRRPVLVEHTSLKIEAFNGIPDLQTSYFYSKIGYEAIVRFCEFSNEFRATVESAFCVCDGRRYLIGKGEEEGRIKQGGEISKEGFDWDKIFIPDTENPDNKTYAEQGEAKNKRSMRKKAWEDLKRKIESEKPDLSRMEFDDKELEELARLIKRRKVLLFVGAGISASVGLPSWSKLIAELGETNGYEPGLFELYGDKMLLAEYADLHGNADIYAYVKEKFSIEGNEALRKKLSKSEIYKALFNLNFPVIYTTNYDHLIEEYYKMQGHNYKYGSVIKIDDLEELEPSDTRIMKFHGDIEDKETIVLTESQYFSRMDYQHFMDVQLQADLQQYHVLYLGYSLSDINIKLMLYRSRKRWAGSSEGKGKKSFIFSATPNQIQKAVFEGNGIVTFSGEEYDKKKGTLAFLKALERKIQELPE